MTNDWTAAEAEALEARCRDLAHSADVTVDAITAALRGEFEPLRYMYLGYTITFRWWERPHWLWRRRATLRMQRQVLADLAEEDGRFEQSVK